MDFRRKNAQDKSCKLGLAEADDRCFLIKNLSFIFALDFKYCSHHIYCRNFLCDLNLVSKLHSLTSRDSIDYFLYEWYVCTIVYDHADSHIQMPLIDWDIIM